MTVDDTLTGKKLGDYTIQGLLGRGGMSRVYKGYDENLDRYAAVKVISGDFATTSEEEYTRRFQTEARAIARLRHPNIVGVYQFGRIEGIYYMAQVFLEGKDLRTLLKRYAERQERMPHHDVLRIVGDITNALDYAHEQGVIHRDIKPSNIMLEQNTHRAILMDFGLALSVHEGTMGDTFGSAHYIAPEQALSSAQALPQSDLYSLGIVIYEMLTGTVPFDDPSVMSVALKHLNDPPPPPTLYNPDLPPAVEAVIMRLLDKDPDRRHASGRELYHALREAFVHDEVGDMPGAVTPVSAILESDLSSPFDDAPPPDWSEPSPDDSTPPPREAGRTALADRFARRREEREAEEGLGNLEIDDETLNSILDSYTDPAEVEYDSVIRPSQPSQGQPQPAQHRRSRLGVTLVALLLVAIVGSGLWFGLGLGDGDDDASQADDPSAIAAGDHTATDTALPTFTRTAQPTATEPATASPTANNTATRNAAAVITQTDPTVTATPTTTDTATATMTDTATATATASATATVTASSTATTTASPTRTATNPPAVAAASSPSARAPNIRLVYSEESPGQGQFLLINLTADTLDISDLVFEREQSSGGLLRYEAQQWEQPGISASPDAMPGQSCFQLVTTNGTARATGGRDCPNFLGFYRTNIPSRYFWLAGTAGAFFTVRYADQSEPLALCATEAQVCEFYAGPDAETVVVPPPTATGTIPAAAALATATLPPDGSSATLQLRYDSDSVLLINTGTQPVDVRDLVFRQETASGNVRSFAARLWDRSDIITPPSDMWAGGCYQLVRADGTQDTPPRNICQHFLGWFSTGVTSRYFWLSSDPNAVFSVWLQGHAAPLAICPANAGTCDVVLPQDG